MISKLMGFGLAIVVLSSSSVATAGDQEKKGHPVSAELKQFKTLLTAIDAAGLTEALSQSKPVTIFAPTEEAFASLPKGVLASLLKDKAKLRSILKLHVVPGKVPASKVAKAKSLETLAGSKLAVKVHSCDESGKTTVQINDATVVKADIRTRNGIIHVVDKVILPPAASAN